MSSKSERSHRRRSVPTSLAKSQTANKECGKISKEIGHLNAELEMKELEIGSLKRNLDQERLIKESVIRSLTLLLTERSIVAGNQMSAEGDAFTDRKKLLLKRHLIDERKEETSKLQCVLDAYEKRLQKKEIQLASLNDQATRLIRSYQRNRLEIEALHLGITPLPTVASTASISSTEAHLHFSDLVVGSTSDEETGKENSKHKSLRQDSSFKEFSF